MTIRRADGVAFEPSGEGVVILDPEGTIITTLNPVGALIWREFDGERGVADLASDLVATFDGIDEEQLVCDIAEFVDSLEEFGLVEVD